MAYPGVLVTYLGHSGFFMEFPETTLIFDWYEGELPPIRPDVPLYVFISHLHSDHYNSDIWDIVLDHAAAAAAEVFLGYDFNKPALDETIDSFSDDLLNHINFLRKGGLSFSSENGKVKGKTLYSTDWGVAFLVETEGKRIFHAGDLAIWQKIEYSFEKRYDGPLMEMLMAQDEGMVPEKIRNFYRFTEPLKGLTIDFGMLPLDSRFGEAGYMTIERYMRIAKWRWWFPMHFWGKYGYLDKFVGRHPDYASRMIGPVSVDGVALKIGEGRKFRILRTE